MARAACSKNNQQSSILHIMRQLRKPFDEMEIHIGELPGPGCSKAG